ncbi:uridine permease [Cryptococcus neoformans var. grubii Br795]|uniref:Uridine permease n=1 Tax=Cryptococcus neoformans Tu259-1 TaxID=1230072 RepID=A0A854Q5Q1_CRYNE|nr:uridine permease [Cryptococcus neoformans var. grubii AD1-83a]OXG14432.1 uridine permease [Cryptococcus neoformans var. grubii Tu259-1]OXG44352.1 uridine permease [Cryptococcus neoformans var. grubii MW-RSA1955]OXG48144.1 uridine permease [Cryptococcus neoformans var. grubii CHC193]OXG59464.1 uridine permease [Cryptococcus neoformans var. grubii c8]OXG71606.1 uridine permease [Cryptococcus neoformans var. grubii MW-RSA36]OXG71994.1 uridine permease [Cryptococcus neoformans var. grubii Br79
MMIFCPFHWREVHYFVLVSVYSHSLSNILVLGCWNGCQLVERRHILVLRHHCLGWYPLQLFRISPHLLLHGHQWLRRFCLSHRFPCLLSIFIWRLWFILAWPVFNRALSACVWNGVNTVTGQCIYIFLHSIFPSIAHLPNHMPSTSGMTSAQMCGFFLFWFFTGCALFLSVPKWKILIHAKLIAYFLSCVGMLALALTTSKGVGNTLTAGPTAHGSERAWLIVRFTLLSAAGCSTFASNASDWQRNATRKRDPIFGQIFGFPMSNFITTLCGLIVAASSEKAYGTLIWNPLTYLDRILTENYDAKTRAGTAIISIGFAYSALFSCVFENVLPAGNDISSLAPKYLSMKRAFAICMIITVVLLFLKYLPMVSPWVGGYLRHIHLVIPDLPLQYCWRSSR